MIEIKNGILYFNGTQVKNFTKNDNTNKSNFKEAPKKLKIQMGYSCNFSCNYCLQSPDKLVKPNIINNLKDLDLSYLEKVELWGGEPFLYLESIYEILEFFRDKNLEISIINNISLLTKDILINIASYGNNISLGLSHDGPMQDDIRGKVNNAKLKKLLRIMDNLDIKYGFNVTLSRDNYNLLDIDHFFKPFGASVNYDFVEPHDELSFDNVIKDVSDYSIILNEFLEKSSRNETCPNNFYHYSEKSVSNLYEFIDTPYDFTDYGDYRCDIDNKLVVTMNADGKITSCQNDNRIIGETIEDADITKADLNIFDKCKSCDYYFHCNSVCPYIKDLDYFERMCNLKYTHSKTTINFVKKQIIKQLGE